MKIAEAGLTLSVLDLKLSCYPGFSLRTAALNPRLFSYWSPGKAEIPELCVQRWCDMLRREKGADFFVESQFLHSPSALPYLVFHWSIMNSA